MEFKKFKNSLNLESINFLLSYKEDGPKWSISKTEKIENLYKKFLYLSFLYPDKMLVPTKDLDEYWHHHILDTQKYYTDCMNVFGGIFHHYPYLGTKGEDDLLELNRHFEHTDKLFQKHFNEPLIGKNTACGGGGGSCGGGCRGVVIKMSEKTTGNNVYN